MPAEREPLYPDTDPYPQPGTDDLREVAPKVVNLRTGMVHAPVNEDFCVDWQLPSLS